MRKLNDLGNCFIPKHEKEWEARLFIDSAIKGSVEYQLEAIARALSGRHEIRFTPADESNPFINKEDIQGDDGKWVSKTSEYQIEARMDSFIFYGKNKIQIWTKIIDFWAGKESIFPCGSASFPNEDFNVVSKENISQS